MGVTTGIFGASGYAGGELIRLLDGHPGFDVVYLGAHSHAGRTLGDVHPQLGSGDRPLGSNRAEEAGSLDLAFLALPHGASARIGRELAARGTKVVDLGSDFRLDRFDRYEEAYGTPHPYPDELADWVYGLPELFNVAAERVAVPGCYPTATLLAVAPLVARAVAQARGIVADCLSGVTGAGRSLKDELLFGEVAEGVRAYAVTTHRHRPEIEMGLELVGGTNVAVTFTPHLVPMQRGLLATVTAPWVAPVTQDEVRQVLADHYAGRAFVEVIDRPPQTRWTVGSNRALVTAFVDERQGLIIALCALDNLLKGASGQAVQAANLMVGLEETVGLPVSGWLP